MEYATKHFIQFKKQREVYEKQVKEKNIVNGANITRTTYQASIEDADLNVWLAAG